MSLVIEVIMLDNGLKSDKISSTWKMDYVWYAFHKFKTVVRRNSMGRSMRSKNIKAKI